MKTTNDPTFSFFFCQREEEMENSPWKKQGKNMEQNSPKKPVLWMVEFFLF
jgi:hypothetical protein|tara:strand:+ start:161 stop:313 length:153 start_codon:yes stop_codon:yes gene_type:complete